MGAGVQVVKTLGRLDLVLLTVVAIVNINNVPATAVYGSGALLLWVVAFLAFFVPSAIAVLVMARRHPGEGGIYLWIRASFGPGHGFVAGWCYWVNNLFYVPVLLVYMAGIVAFSLGGGGALAENPRFVGGVALGWLVLVAGLNIRGLALGKWLQNAGGAGVVLSVLLVVAAAAAGFGRGVAEDLPPLAPLSLGMVASFSVMCNAFVGAELASTMGDEIANPARDLGPAIVIAGALSLGAYLLVTAAILVLVPSAEIGVIQGIMQAVERGAVSAGVPWIVGPVAILLGISIGGAASAWFAGSARVPFVAGLTQALPASLGRVHPRWHSPHVALSVCAIAAGAFTVLSLLGATVGEAYQVLLKAAVVIQLIPFLYLFVGLVRLADATPAQRVAGLVGLATAAFGVIAAFFPTEEVGSVLRFEAKMALGVIGPLLLAWLIGGRRDRRIAG